MPCPPGQYCQPGTAVAREATCGTTTLCGVDVPQPVRRARSRHAIEQAARMGSARKVRPVLESERRPCRGHYCPFGVRLACPAGAFCPRDGLSAPIVCEPGFFNGMVGQVRCTACPRGAICPGFGRIQPAICPPATLVLGETGRAEHALPSRALLSERHGHGRSAAQRYYAEALPVYARVPTV